MSKFVFNFGYKLPGPEDSGENKKSCVVVDTISLKPAVTVNIAVDG